MNAEPGSFEEFWPEYVRAHSDPWNRRLHVIGMSLALACLIAGIFKQRLSLLLLAPIFGYGFAWAGHFFVEKNAPKSFSHPVYSLRASALLFWKTICNEMDEEVRRAAESPSPDAPTAETPATVDIN